MSGSKTLTIIKPCAISKELIGTILVKINAAGFHIAAMKFLRLTKIQAENFYAVHREKSFYLSLVEFMTSGPVVVAILEKQDAVNQFRKLIGDTNPAEAEENTIRRLYGESVRLNAIHGSDSDSNAEFECDFFFAKSERFSLFD